MRHCPTPWGRMGRVSGWTWMPTDLAASEGETRTVPGLAEMALALESRISYVIILSLSKGPDQIPWLWLILGVCNRGTLS